MPDVLTVEVEQLGRGEVAGEWMGTGAARLGLAGKVKSDELRTLLAGREPLSGERDLRTPAEDAAVVAAGFRRVTNLTIPLAGHSVVGSDASGWSDTSTNAESGLWTVTAQPPSPDSSTSARQFTG